uniref:Uncharacterized protein n=1 Tax=viral metagenome TaxID=1070528 RepID=A0A6C0FDI4_9ZZZZ
MFMRNCKCNRIEGVESSDEKKWQHATCDFQPYSNTCSQTSDNQKALDNNQMMIYNKIEELESKIENLDCGTSSDTLQGELDKLNSILIKNRMIECHDETGNQYNCPRNLRPAFG